MQLVTLRTVAVLLLCSSLYGLGWLTAPSRTARAQNDCIAIIDLEAIFDASEKARQLEVFINSEREKKLATLEGMKREIERFRQEIHLIKPGSDEHQRIEKGIFVKEGELKFSQEKFQRDLKIQWAAARSELLDEIKALIKKYAEEHGHELVLQTKLPSPDGGPPWEMVLHAREGVDITPAIIQLLNGN